MRYTLICLLVALRIASFPVDIKGCYWHSLSEEKQSETSTEAKAWLADMSVEEFELLSAVVEAESDRSESMDGKTLIALTILNRVESGSFPNTISKVIKQSGQFQVYYEGTYKKTGRTDTSDRACVEAAIWHRTEHPNVIYFNSIGYNHLGTPYDYVDGNYFETA